MHDLRTVTVAERPDLIPTVADWLWQEFWRADGCTLEQTRQAVAQAQHPSGVPQCFVLLRGDQPIGTASLAAEDLDERPDLTPWLAGVYVVPAQRRQGHVARLIAAVEAACRSASIPTLWLYTSTAEQVYARAGWQNAGSVERRDKRPTTLMRRDLIACASG